MSSLTDRDVVNNSEVDTKALDHYICSLSVCNGLALLVSQSSSEEFAVRIALLTTLQECWRKGHSVLKLECSSDGAISCISDKYLYDVSTADSPVPLTDDLTSLLDIKSSNRLQDDDAGGIWSDSTAEYLGACSNMLEKSVIAADEDIKSIQEATERTALQSESSLMLSGDTDNVCDVCCRQFANSSSLTKHVKRVHNTEQLETSTSQNIGNGNSTGSQVKGDKAQFICTVCGRQFRIRQLLAAHSVTHSGARPAACRFPGCDKRFGQTSTRNYHERTHSEVRQYVCSQCGQSFKHTTILKTHITTVHGSGARPHQCSQCHKAFKLHGALQTHHKTVHMDQRPHPCTECPKRFKYRSQLSRHTRALHSNERPWHCGICERTFTQPGNLRTHLRRHTGEKPYSCTICHQTFAHSGTLKGHMTTHKQTSVLSNRDSSTLI